MKAEDTVMSPDAFLEVIRDYEKDYPPPTTEASDTFIAKIGKRTAKKQAEISFVAGEKEMFKKVRQFLSGELVVFDYALDGVEIDWLYQRTKGI